MVKTFILTPPLNTLRYEMQFRSVNILICGKCKHFFSLRLISPVFCFPFARLSGFCRFLRFLARRLLPSARMDGVGTFRWHQVTFFLPRRHSCAPLCHPFPPICYLPRRGGKLAVPRAVSNKSARRSKKSARRSDEAQEKSDLMPPKSAYDVHPCGRQKPAGKKSEETAKTGQPCE